MSSKTIEVEHLSKAYGSTAAIEDVHFSVDAGEIIGFLGPNGAGKTTTMRILAGYLPATSGTVKIAGYDVHRHSMEVRRRIGYLPEVPPLYPDMSVKQYLYFVSKIKGIRAGDRRRQVYNAMVRCQLIERENTVIRQLSKGYRQRVGIAQAIVHEPPVIILDEPTVGLDPRQIIEVRNLIKSLAREHTIILSTHILPEASMICDRVIIINQGKVVTTNTPQDLQGQLEISSGYEIELSGNLEIVLPLLKAIPGVTNTILDNNLSIEDTQRHMLRVTCKSTTEPGKDIAALIVRQGLELHELRRTRPSLEDVFLELTTEEPLSVYNQ
ncbi:ABC transporter ATP-binding protein [Waterburya agarophytonicola K14]|uniref:ABC transporter ATP-binding protein n=2 Tax=Waterburya TaxID=2886915 RepID=A0A964BPS5_9CYAN|nr:ABC transporter ATP-binding protein [Waterburya agarophytonicola KI4]